MNPSWNCSIANFTMPFSSLNPNATVGGWASQNCSNTLPYMCRVQNKQATPSMTTQSTNQTYYFNTTMTTFADAERSCMNNGGHIAGFSSEAEQLEVEGFFMSQGYIIKTWHNNYWYGATTNSTLWPLFSHLYGTLGDIPDPYPPPPDPANQAPPFYTNWCVACACAAPACTPCSAFPGPAALHASLRAF